MHRSPSSIDPDDAPFSSSVPPRSCFSTPQFRLSSHVHASPASPDHFFVSVSLSFPNKKTIHTYALIDSGATNSCISLAFCDRHGLARRPKSSPVPIRAVNDRPIASGYVTHDLPTSLRVRDHSEIIALNIVSVSFPVILGLDWLRRHNPSIDWARQQLALTCCGPYSTLPPRKGEEKFSNHIGTPPTSVSSCSTTTMGLGLGLRSRLVAPRCVFKSSKDPPPIPAQVSILSATAVPWYSPRSTSQIVRG